MGHRYGRDERITTHCGLVARAFWADEFILSGDKDTGVLESLKKVVERWGGLFEVNYEKNWKKVLRDFNGIKVHLTMYGLQINKKINEIKKHKKDFLVVIGGEKVPAEVYSLVDYNIAVGNQPHSEVAALSVFLDRFFEGEELSRKFEDAKIRIVPKKNGKETV